jgi:formylglycine-generating enzyme required for sulfatase activity
MIRYYICIVILLIAWIDCRAENAKPRAAAQNSYVAKDGSTMTLVSGGKFTMGSQDGDPDELPAHEVYVDSFYIDVHEVTIGQYKKFMEATGHQKPYFWQPELDKKEDPAVGVSCQDAADYATWAGKRLPTEAEWEYAARGGNLEGIYPWGDASDTSHANFKSFGILPVKSLKPNNYGVYDMIGNVWEWCSDWYDKDYYYVSQQKNPRGPATGTHKVLRGGAWHCAEDEIRVSNRYFALPDAKSFNVGFRCAQWVK